MSGPHDSGFCGEQHCGFILGQRGYELIDGPSGAGGHGITEPGFDGVAYNHKTGNLIAFDNKTFKRVGNVTSATAIDPAANLRKNLRTMINHIQTHPNLAQVPHRAVILQRLQTAEQAVTNWIAAGRQGPVDLGGSVRLVVFNAGGNSTGIGGKLARTGAIEFEDLNAPPRIPGATAPPRGRGATRPAARMVTVDDLNNHAPPRSARARTSVSGSLGKLPSAGKLGLGVTSVEGVRSALAMKKRMEDVEAMAGDRQDQEMLERLKRTSIGGTPIQRPGVFLWEDMLKSLGNLPPMKPDLRAASSYLSDPDTAAAIRALDLMDSNLKPFGQELNQHHAEVRANTMMEIVAGSLRPAGQRLDSLNSLQDQLDVYTDELNVVFDNLEAARGVSAKVLGAARDADQLATGIVVSTKLLTDAGLSIEQVTDMNRRLNNFSTLARRTFQDVDALHAQVQRQLQELADDSWKANQIYWSTIAEPLIYSSAPGQNSGGLSKDAERVLRVLPSGLSRPGGPGSNPGLSADEIYQRVRRDGGGFIPGIQTINTALRELERVSMVDSMSGSLTKQGGEYWRNSKGDNYLKARPAL